MNLTEIPTPRTDQAIVEILDMEATKSAGSSVTAVRRRYVQPMVSRQLEREAAAWRSVAEMFYSAGNYNERKAAWMAFDALKAQLNEKP